MRAIALTLLLLANDCYGRRLQNTVEHIHRLSSPTKGHREADTSADGLSSEQHLDSQSFVELHQMQSLGPFRFSFPQQPAARLNDWWRTHRGQFLGGAGRPAPPGGPASRSNQTRGGDALIDFMDRLRHRFKILRFGYHGLVFGIHLARLINAQSNKTHSQANTKNETNVTFNDVAGVDSAKLELKEVVDFLKFPDKYTALGARLPKGVLLEGPPGTGKTLLAKAVAGEAGVPFIFTSGSEFVEMYIGLGAARVRELFGKARKTAPCIIFIDEIDAIGVRRGSDRSREYEQTLNQILVEMDSFTDNRGIIVIAATNRAEILDPALTRPGRFDRRIPISLPDVEGRLAILKVHSKNKPLDDKLDLAIIAKRTIGFSGASLANLMNEAAIVAARNNKTTIGYEEIDYAIDRKTVGLQQATGLNFPNRQKLVAYHEAGHAIVGLLTPGYDMVTKVTIIPRTNGAGGFTLFTPQEEQVESGMYSKRYLCGQLAVALGGRVAEEIVYGKDGITTGASSDLQQVREIAYRMVTQWGFAEDAMGNAPVAWEAPNGNHWMERRTFSSETEKQIDEQVKKLVIDAYDMAYKTLSSNRAMLDALMQKLVEEETLDYSQLEKICSDYVVAPYACARPIGE